LANTGFQTVYNYRPTTCAYKLTARRYASVIWNSGNGIRWNETKHIELEQFLHAFVSRGFDSVSWAFLFLLEL